MPPRQEASPDDIEMGSIFSALMRRLPRLLIWSIALGGLTYGGLMMVAPKYQSQAEMTIVAKGASHSLGDKTNSPDSLTIKMDKEAINTHVRALQSPDLIARIAEQMELGGKREFNSALGPVDAFDTVTRLVGLGGPRPGESERDRVLNALFKNLEIYSAKESRFIGVRATSIDPELSAEIANRVAETYRNSLASAATQEVDDQQKVLQGKIDKLMPEVAAIETEVERYRGEINVFKGGSQNTGLNEQQLSELTAELTKAKASRSESEARAKSAREMMKAGSADALPDVQKSPLIQNLVQQRVRIERQISELSASLLPGHPRMQQLNADLAGLKRQITGEVSKLVESLEKEAKVSQGREESIKRSLDEIKTRVVDNAPEEAKLRQLEANAKAKRNELESLQSQLESNRKRLDTRAQPVEAQIITRAAAPSLPVFPKKGQSAALVAFATFLLGAFWTITRSLFESARSGVRTIPARAKDAPAVRAEPALSTAAVPAKAKPDAAKKAAKPAEPAQTKEEGAALSVEEVAQRLEQCAPGDGGYRALVTAETQGMMDAGLEALALAKALDAAGHHTILVDWSPSGKGMAGAAGVAAAAGLTELLTQTAGFEDAVQRVPGTNVHLIACGAPLDEIDDVDPDQLNLVLDALDEAYNFIIVTGGHDDCRVLFEAIQGRFDAGILVRDPKKPARVLKDPPGTFLGFEVSDIDVIKMDKKQAIPPVSPQRIMRAVRGNGPEARPN
jgi:uncharacterized protein involved in exopolysaccharide biosynthesis